MTEQFAKKFIRWAAGVCAALTALTVHERPASAFEDPSGRYCSVTNKRGCSSDSDCPGGETCLTATGCLDGFDNDGDGLIDRYRCSGNAALTCVNNTQCSGAGVCKRGVCTGYTGGSANNGAPCFDGSNCTGGGGGYCAYQTNDPDCGVEMYCQDSIDNDLDGLLDNLDPDCFGMGNLGCTANDVKFVAIGLGIQDDGCVSPLDTVSLYLGGELQTGAVDRYDIGMWVDLDGDGTAQSGNTTRMILDPLASTATNHQPFFPGKCTVSGGFCRTHIDCPLFSPNSPTPLELCQIVSFNNSAGENDFCGEITTRDKGYCSGTRTACEKDSNCTPGTCVFAPEAQNADFIWPIPITLSCKTNPVPNGFVAIARCSTWGQNAADINCSGVQDATAGTSSKCACEEGTAASTTVPLPNITTSCSCDSPTTVRPGYPVTCKVSYNNAASCTVGTQTERYQCGTAGFLRMDLDDNAETGAFAGICTQAGLCTGNGTTPCTTNSDCSVAGGTCGKKGYCSTSNSTRCNKATDCPGGSCLVSSCTSNAQCSGRPGAGTCSAGATTVSIAADTMKWTPTSGSGSLGIIGPGRTESLTFLYTPSAANGAFTVDMQPIWVNQGTCSVTTGTLCETAAQCPVGEKCVPDFTKNPAEQTVIKATCALNASATYASVSGVSATRNGSDLIVEFETSSEVGSIGFDLLRWDISSSKWLKVNQDLIPALQHLPGATYRIVDPEAPRKGAVTYRVVEIDGSGVEHVAGDYAVEPTPAYESRSMQEEFAWAHEPTSESMTRLETSIHEVHSSALTQSSFASSLSASSKRARILVGTTSMYFVADVDIATALGVSLTSVRKNIASNGLNLTNQGAQVAWRPAPGRGGIEFLGQENDSPYSRTNSYFLSIGTGRQMAEDRATSVPTNRPVSFRDTAHSEEDLLPRPNVATGPRDDYWFWSVVFAGRPQYGTSRHTIRTPGAVMGARDAQLSVVLRAVSSDASASPYSAEIAINGTTVAMVSDPVSQIAIHPALLRDGDNEIEVLGTAGQFYVDSFDLEYDRAYRAENDRLTLKTAAAGLVTVESLPVGAVEIFNVSNPRNPLWVGHMTTGHTPTGLMARFLASSNSTYEVVGASAIRPVRPVADRPSKLLDRATRGAYVVIAPVALKSAAQALAEHRIVKGLSAIVVDLEDIYDEFSHGNPDPEAIRNFLVAAKSRWRESPQYLVLAGKGSIDYKDNLLLGGNLVPPILSMTNDGLVVSDNAYGDLDGRSGLEVAVGRIPALTNSELQSYVDKVKAYEAPGATPEWAHRALMVADDADEGGDFAVGSQRLAGLLTQRLSVELTHLGAPYSLNETRQRVLSGINSGAKIFNFVGHGGFDRMGSEGILTSADVAQLANQDRLPVVTALACNLAYHAYPGFSALGERLLLHPSGGAAAVWGPSWTSMDADSVEMGASVLNELSSSNATLGRALSAGLSDFVRRGGNPDTLRVYGLLGDPALTVR